MNESASSKYFRSLNVKGANWKPSLSKPWSGSYVPPSPALPPPPPPGSQQDDGVDGEFWYWAMDAKGDEVHGTVYAKDRNAAYYKLRRQGLYPTDAQETLESLKLRNDYSTDDPQID